jgi:hypothetical protein
LSFSFAVMNEDILDVIFGRTTLLSVNK